MPSVHDGVSSGHVLIKNVSFLLGQGPVLHGKIKQDIANILSMLCKRKGVKIVEAEICPDHVHMLVEITRKHKCIVFCRISPKILCTVR